MKIVLLHRKAASKSVELGRWSWAALSLLCLGIPVGVALMGYDLGHRSGVQAAQEARLSEIEQEGSRRARELAQLSADAKQKIAAMTRRLASLQARMTRLDALGSHLTELTGLDTGEFDFEQPPALGGPIASADVAVDPAQFEQDLTDISQWLDDRDLQFEVLAHLLSETRHSKDAQPAGRPIKSGWLSSPYGYRKDPFTGKRAWHQGIDFAGKEDGEVIAVASGVVSWSGERAGYGQMIEVAHGNGLVTRYAHNKQNLVAVGDIIRRGETIARLGSTGRSTGPHVHFEVFKNGRPVDPSSYVRRNIR